MNSTAIRIYSIIGIIFAAYIVNRLVLAGIEPPEAMLPDWTFHQMPMQLGTWSGEETKLDPVIAAATNANVIVDRNYRNEDGMNAVMHTAVFANPADGVLHTPLNCYSGAGWLLMDEEQASVNLSEDRQIPVKIVTWKKDGSYIKVLFWYQLGEHILFDRLGLGSLRFEMRGKKKWPAVVKVMLQVPADDPSEAKRQLLELAEQIAKWENLPEHQTYYQEKPATP